VVASHLCWKFACPYSSRTLHLLRERDIVCSASDDEADDNAVAVGSDEAESGSEAEDAADAMSEEEDD